MTIISIETTLAAQLVKLAYGQSAKCKCYYSENFLNVGHVYNEYVCLCAIVTFDCMYVLEVNAVCSM